VRSRTSPRSAGRSSGSTDPDYGVSFSMSDGLPRPGITVENGPDFADRVQHRGVILAAEGPADLGERGVGELPRQIHGDLTGEGHRFRPILGLQLGELDAEEFGNLPLNQLDRSSWVRSFPAMN
jgi:hypothetical protein